jgi:hypothetical protein
MNYPDKPAILQPKYEGVWQIPPTQQRTVAPVPPAPTITDVLQSVASLKARVADAVPNYEASKTDTTGWDRLKVIGEQLAVLVPQVKALEAEAEAIKNAPKADEAFLQNVIQLEHECRMAAGSALGLLQDAKSRDVFEIPFRELSPDTQADIVKPLRPLAQLAGQAQSMLALTRNATVAAAKSTLLRLAGNLAKIAEFTTIKAEAYNLIPK